jgi:hypothetical protein
VARRRVPREEEERPGERHGRNPGEAEQGRDERPRRRRIGESLERVWVCCDGWDAGSRRDSPGYGWLGGVEDG